MTLATLLVGFALGAAALLVFERLKRRPAPQPIAAEEDAEPADHELLDSVDVVTWDRDAATGRFLFVNAYARKLLGYDTEEWIRDPRFWTKVVHRDDQQKVSEAVVRATAAAEPTQVRYRLIARDGWVVEATEEILPIRDRRGLVVRLRGTVTPDPVPLPAEPAFSDPVAPAPGSGDDAPYRALYERLPIGVYAADHAFRITAVNPALARITGYPERDLIGLSLADFHTDPEVWRRLRAELLRLGEVRDVEVAFVRLDRPPIWVRQTIHRLTDDAGEPIGYEATVEDITDHKLAQEAERRAEARFRSLVEQSLVGTFIVQMGRLSYSNPKMWEIFGYSHDELAQIGSFAKLAIGEDRDDVRARMEEITAGGSAGQAFSFRARRSDGEVIDVEVHASPMRVNGHSAVIGMVMDITRRKEAEAQLVHTALHDPLTGLPNRLLFMGRLEHAVARAARSGSRSFGLLFMDLDRFKHINDTLGHHVGDEFLVEVAERLRKVVRPGDTVARMGGDEFAILLEELEDASDATRVAERVAAEVSVPVNLSGFEAQSTASMGIVIAGQGNESPEHLLRSADMAMYRAKSLGRGRCEVFDRAMHADALARLQLETDLRAAIDRGELRLHYQPIVSLASGRISAFEALVRWQHPVQGLMMPADFVPLAEETGMIVAIGRWVLREACRQLAQWRAHHPHAGRLSVGVNLSAKQLLQADFIDEIEELIRDHDVSRGSLRLEFTERTLMENADASSSLLQRVRDLGIELYLDDFGKGYSAIGHLHRLPLDMLKIDRASVSRINGEPADADVVRMLVHLAQDLQVEVVAEGVETVAQLKAVRRLGCQFAQGFLISQPLDAADAEALIAADRLPWMDHWPAGATNERTTF